MMSRGRHWRTETIGAMAVSHRTFIGISNCCSFRSGPSTAIGARLSPLPPSSPSEGQHLASPMRDAFLRHGITGNACMSRRALFFSAHVCSHTAALLLALQRVAVILVAGVWSWSLTRQPHRPPPFVPLLSLVPFSFPRPPPPAPPIRYMKLAVAGFASGSTTISLMPHTDDSCTHNCGTYTCICLGISPGYGSIMA